MLHVHYSNYHGRYINITNVSVLKKTPLNITNEEEEFIAADEFEGIYETINLFHS